MLDSTLLQRVILNGVVLSLILGVIIIGSLRYNARLWLQDYPKAIRERVPPLSPGERRIRAVLAVAVMGILFGGVLLQALQLRAAPVGKVPFGAAYLYLFILLMVFNLFDALVLDLIILTWLKPKFVILPGTEGMERLLYDYRKQGIDFLKGVVFSAVASLPFAVIAIL